MSILERIAVSVPEAPRITIYGKPGIGKTTLASQFPEPLFLLTEKNGLVDSNCLGVYKDYAAIWKDVEELLTLETLPFKTLVIDS